MARIELTEEFLAEVIALDGHPVRRADAYLIAVEDTGDLQAARQIAYGADAELSPDQPLTIAEYRAAIERLFDGMWSAAA